MDQKFKCKNETIKEKNTERKKMGQIQILGGLSVTQNPDTIKY